MGKRKQQSKNFNGKHIVWEKMAILVAVLFILGALLWPELHRRHPQWSSYLHSPTMSTEQDG
ncbi:hypothetical protein CHK60_22665 [Salmonella enterica subsp. enterica serovar Stanley]|uniref:Uncharacterized protein n=1 Tax=Salmonella enterica TaxID=28901 RepID=A0A3V7Z0W7_SALER|nr:hypothetical protein [Salmonella enterica]EDD6035984.1 hypothetical protein [Salmonella enterica subsp. enterica serovar Stanley]EDV3836361.1 hypothetical protein [Salmonella enterica subsp. diarizonae]EAZ3130102.1 hypothetical protein [Salmonella enterica]EDJ7126546.1 hypothetical protein [Salmonella enterica subsp. enterica serovar Stanley]